MPIGDRASSRILHPASAEDLIDEEDFERDERLPYWAELWPSSRVLGERVLLDCTGGGRSLHRARDAAPGWSSTCAALAGFDVVASDYYEDALRFARVNAARNGARPRELLLDWRQLSASPSPLRRRHRVGRAVRAPIRQGGRRRHRRRFGPQRHGLGCRPGPGWPRGVHPGAWAAWTWNPEAGSTSRSTSMRFARRSRSSRSFAGHPKGGKQIDFDESGAKSTGAVTE